MKYLGKAGREWGQFGGALFGAIRAGLESGPCRSLSREEIEVLQAACKIQQPEAPRRIVRPHAW